MTESKPMPTMNAEMAERPRSMRDALKEAGSVHSMPEPLERLMKEVAPDESGSTTLRMERRLGILERAFADIVERHDKATAERMAAVKATDDRVSAIMARLDDVHKEDAAALGELRESLGEARMRL